MPDDRDHRNHDLTAGGRRKSASSAGTGPAPLPRGDFFPAIRSFRGGSDRPKAHPYYGELRSTEMLGEISSLPSHLLRDRNGPGATVRCRGTYFSRLTLVEGGGSKVWSPGFRTGGLGTRSFPQNSGIFFSSWRLVQKTRDLTVTLGERTNNRSQKSAAKFREGGVNDRRDQA